MTEIRLAEMPRDLNDVRKLFLEYAASLSMGLEFQNFESEVAALPDKYEPPNGQLLLAWSNNEAVGCVAFRPLDPETCEMKRLYVQPELRGTGLGRRLAERICKEARAAEYSRICLDTLPTMAKAIRLYTDLGFEPIEPYVFNPIPGARFLALQL